MTRRLPDVALRELVDRAERGEAPVPGRSYRQIGVKLWGAGAYDRGPLDGGATTYRSLNKVAEGDIVVNKIWARNGSVAVVDDRTAGCYGSAEFPVFAPRRDRLNPRWFHWYTKMPALWAQCDDKSRGTSGKNRMNPALFLEVTIPLPSLEEQGRIVGRVEAVSSRIDEARRLREDIALEARQMLALAYRSMVTNAPVGLMRDIAPLIRRPVAIDLDTDYFELGVRSFGRGAFHKPSISGADLGTKRIFEIHPGDLVFNIVFSWEGAVAVASDVDGGRVGSHRFLTCVPRADVATAEFLRFHFLATGGLKQLGEASPGGAGRNRTLGLKNLENLLVPVPPVTKQRWFDGLQVRASHLLEYGDKCRVESDALVRSVLRQAFAGEL